MYNSIESKYRIVEMSSDTLSSNKIEPDYIFSDNTLRRNIIEDLPEGPIVHFELTNYDFNNLTEKLKEFEMMYKISTLDIFRQYNQGNLPIEFEEWIDVFLLYLGTLEIRQYSCP